MDYWHRKVQEKRSPKYRRSVRLMGACYIVLGAACLGAYPGVGAFHLTRQNSYLGAYPGYYGTKVMCVCVCVWDKTLCGWVSLLSAVCSVQELGLDRLCWHNRQLKELRISYASIIGKHFTPKKNQWAPSHKPHPLKSHTLSSLVFI